ncbi:MAG: hypothetical protein J3K34DRAFT_479684 [Monoraphidium minutum]|nr:MAG: hypothetical protein J3K34DRAFT_479684 [Monoraphidium minutum]
MPRGQQQRGARRGAAAAARAAPGPFDAPDGFVVLEASVFNQRWREVPADRRGECHLIHFAPGLPSRDFQMRPLQGGCPVAHEAIGVQWGAFPGLPLTPLDVALARLPPSAANMRFVRACRAPGRAAAAAPQMAFSMEFTRDVRPGHEMLSDWSEVTPPPELVGPVLAAAGAPFPIGYEMGPGGVVRLVEREEEQLGPGGRPQRFKLPRSALGLAPRACAGCGAEGADHKCCRRCKRVHYCSKECQKAHWGQHKRECAAPPAGDAAPAVGLPAAGAVAL